MIQNICDVIFEPGNFSEVTSRRVAGLFGKPNFQKFLNAFKEGLVAKVDDRFGLRGLGHFGRGRRDGVRAARDVATGADQRFQFGLGRFRHLDRFRRRRVQEMIRESADWDKNRVADGSSDTMMTMPGFQIRSRRTHV